MPPLDLKPKPKPILRHRPRPKCVRFLAKTVNLETGSIAPVNTRPAKPSHPATAQTTDSKISSERKAAKTTGTSRANSRSRSQSPFKRASSPYPGKISSASTQPPREHHHKPGSRPVAQATTSWPRVRIQSPSPAHKSHREPEASLPHRRRERSTSRARSKTTTSKQSQTYSSIASRYSSKEIHVTIPNNNTRHQKAPKSRSQVKIEIKTRVTNTDTRPSSIASQQPR
ncbi:hypothetical protein DL98DRAFT_622533 [Cadophora sp. DSE1049]|nr:hypothetical protein DL98DRAFT_622533 [Cadophora sp. DSE1049]